MGELDGKVAVVTGGNKGIGKAISLTLAEEGADIVIAARDEEAMEKTCTLIEDKGVKCMPIKTDVSKESDVKSLIDETVDEFGKVDIMINNAGVAVRKLLENTSLEDYNKIMDVNVKGVFLGMREAIPHMREQGSGTIINISSGAGKTGIAEIAVYSASKFAVIGLTEATADEVADDNIKVLAVCPGGTDTDMYHSLFPELEPSLEPEDIAEKVKEACVSGRYRSGSSIEVYG